MLLPDDSTQEQQKNEIEDDRRELMTKTKGGFTKFHIRIKLELCFPSYIIRRNMVKSVDYGENNLNPNYLYLSPFQ